MPPAPSGYRGILTIVFAALAVSRLIERQTGWSIHKFVRTARRYRTVEIQAGDRRRPLYSFKTNRMASDVGVHGISYAAQKYSLIRPSSTFRR